MNGYSFSLSGAALEARASGALFWPERRLLCVSDLHLGKSERIARHGGASLPPYETQDTLSRLDAELAATEAETVVCLGDSFDDNAAAEALPDQAKLWISRLQAGRRWVWIEGNHDPGPVDLGGAHLAELPMQSLVFRHIAQPAQSGEISGHYHPKATLSAKGKSITRPCFLVDDERVILPAFGTYTGGLHAHDTVLSALMRDEALAVLTGPFAAPIPMPR
ncbi:ligase-associated DNA damage response endonuclease PdeM [Alisedimentitalea sp. MJ-SS2]|uniref:ligase-associated DNA damage response endonuclease PdeM n=1 Tax=Aliisedimentitalea sp. MJ-SS2 TaxID=3049795 RepID=UPI00290F3CCC|nr:ligase-associated DNA damage response endonuclease PdeM [Alisedimentitalea sp. MJ-SS2]MDU8926080.1 ligase-associated DNA damage response endonuclease PdeM [Alisedimentitalea sp. MJ-SS2]